jgi:hypothetical protein
MTKKWMRAISVLEIIGGVCGILSIFWLFLVSPFDIYSLLFAPILIGIHAFSLLAGFWLWSGKHKGRTASIIVQIIQVPKIISPYMIFMFSFGFDLWIEFLVARNGMANYGVQLRLLTFYQFFFNAENAPFGLGISITALICLAMLINYKPQALIDNEINEPPVPPLFELNNTEEVSLKVDAF